jgi:hypothetical protein
MRSASASAHFDQRSIASEEIELSLRTTAFGVNVSADVDRSSQRRGFIEQPINPGLFELLLTLSLFALQLQLIVTSVLL